MYFGMTPWNRELTMNCRAISPSGSPSAFCVLIVLILTLMGCGQKDQSERAAADSGKKSENKSSHSIRIAAASDLKFALDEVIQEFHRMHPETKVQATFGSSGTLFAQLTNQAPFDLFLSADLKYPHQLIELDHALADTEFQYAVGHIVVWVPLKSELDIEKLGIQAVTDPKVKKIAIANPKTAPYGRAAEAALKKLGVYDQIASQLVLGENIAQTAQFVEGGSADVGVISLSLALSPAMRDKGRFWRVPADAFPKLEQGGVILKQCQDVPTAKDFKAFLTSPEGGSILKKHGFALPGE